jgi:hypothetical protein
MLFARQTRRIAGIGKKIAVTNRNPTEAGTMTRIAVFTPTCRYGGLDIAIAGLRRQKLREGDEFSWFIVDSCPETRSEAIFKVKNNGDFASLYLHMPPAESGQSSLCQACNLAVKWARTMDADLFIFMHDYTWIPDNGLARFAESCAPNTLTAGVCHHAKYPLASAVAYPKGLYTIFAAPYETSLAPEVSWRDCRHTPGGGVRVCDTIHFEPPWAAIGRDCLYDERLYFDEEFDKAFRYENQDYAFRAKSLGYEIRVDHENEAIQLPHWDYFAKEYADHNAGQERNRAIIKERWGA